VESRQHRFALIALLLLASILRIGWAFAQNHQPDPRLGDQFEYLALGRNLLHEHELKFYDDRFGQSVHAYRTPGYPLFIAFCGGNVHAIQIAQALVDVSTVFAIYLLSRRSLVAAAIVAFNPFLIYFSSLVLSETLFTAMLAWGMYLLLRQKWRIAGLIVLALSVLVRPSALGLVVLLAIVAAWPRGWRAVAQDAAIAGALVAAVLFPWAYRNSHHPQVRSWIWTTTNNGITAYDGFNDRATGASDQKAFVSELRTPLSRMDEVERDNFLSEQTHAWIESHPARSIQLMGSKIARTWSPIPLSNEYGGNTLYVVIGLIYSLPFDVLILLGLWKAALPRTAKVFLLLPAIYFTGIHALSVGSLRYRLPIEPPMAVIVGSWIRHAHGNRNGPSRRKS
jgi:4-amino-4-deoxy-L-arabinose transferase-like glycosyltransferase